MRSYSSRLEYKTSRYCSTLRASESATSVWVFKFVMGVRSSCAISPEKSDRRRNTFSRRSSRSEEHTSELQSLMRISYAVFCLKKKKNTTYTLTENKHNLHTRQNTYT